ncbi:MAG: excinuclease ABC subunit UvrA [Planctomycetaceae bacterium]|nr:excinuclease ABC subunit UvrA [Planctomycetaceae bacterium]
MVRGANCDNGRGSFYGPTMVRGANRDTRVGWELVTDFLLRIDFRMPDSDIVVKGAREHNLRDVDLVLPRNQLICFTGVSGSGKSSMAFDTLFAEGQRRYVESLSSYARQFVGQLPKPDVDFIGGLSPAISISQKAAGNNPRSTVGTMTEIYDFLRILYARIGQGRCPKCNDIIQAQTNEEVIERLMTLPTGTEVQILSPVAQNRKGEQRELIEDLLRQGFTKARVDGRLVRLTAELNLDRRRRHNIEVYVDRLMIRPDNRSQVAECVERALKVGSGNLLAVLGGDEPETAAAGSAIATRSGGTPFSSVGGGLDDEMNLSEFEIDEDEDSDAVSQAVRRPISPVKSKRGPAKVLSSDREPDDAGALKSDEEVAQEVRARSIQWPEGWEEGLRMFSVAYSCVRCGIGYPLPSPQLFSFNSPQGMCLTCKGMGELHTFDENLLVWNRSLSLDEGCFEILGAFRDLSRWQQHILQGFADTVEQERGLPAGYLTRTPWNQLPDDLRYQWLFGTGDKTITFTWQGGTKEMTYQGKFAGIVAELHNRHNAAKTTTSKANFEKYMANIVCPDCHGKRLNPQARHVTLAADAPNKPEWKAGVSLPELCSLAIHDAGEFFERLQLTEIHAKIAADALKEVHNRLRFLMEVGLSYLSLERTAPTLSGGESQRIRLAGQIGASLVGVLYILDEPSIGLHPRDNDRLISALCRLRDLGNTVIVVEHDEDTMLAADHLVDFGPGPGNRGGYLVAEGDPEDVMSNSESKTGGFLSGRLQIAIPEQRKPVDFQRSIHITGARQNNLKNIDVQIPLGAFVCVTGVSGSGKSSLIGDILVEALHRDLNRGTGNPGLHDSLTGLEMLDKLIAIDQSPIGRTPRSNPGTYIKVFDEIRKLYAQMSEAKARGFDAGRFSFNVAGGRCEACQGNGANKLEMDFLADIWVTCQVCQGKRFNRETLQVKFRGFDISQVLSMEIEQALDLFENQPKIYKQLQTLKAVGLEYLQLGQPSPTLSGGEAQRIKLAKELSKVGTGKTLYLLDEPTTGLHFADIQLLIDVLRSFVAVGNTVLVVEHNLDMIKTADWIIDLGPEGGAAGGRVIAQGTPEEVARVPESYTGQALARLFDRQKVRRSTESPTGANVPREKKIKRIPEIAKTIEVEGAQQNNLKNVSLSILRDKMTVFCGPSGSGKSSLAMDTIYAEGQRRYVESLSSYARQFVGQLPKPKLNRIEGLSPAIAIQQRALSATPRSTVGTVTEIYDYLRVLYSRLGQAYCPACEVPIGTQTVDEIVDKVLRHEPGTKLYLLAPLENDPGKTYSEIWEDLRREGYVRVRIDGQTVALDQVPELSMSRSYKIEVLVDRISVNPEKRSRVADSVAAALGLSNGTLVVAYPSENWPEPKWKTVVHSRHLACSACGTSYEPLSPHHFSFNGPLGWCPECEGLGTQNGADPTQLIRDEKLTLRQGAILLWPDLEHPLALTLIEALGRHSALPLDVPLMELSPRQKRVVFYGAGNDWIPVVDPNTRRPLYAFKYQGLFNALEASARRIPQLRLVLQSLIDQVECAFCGGSRLRADAAAVRFQELSMDAATRLPLGRLMDRINRWEIHDHHRQVAGEILREVRDRIQFLNDVGLSYLSLNRAANTLSGGESQRIRLASQLGSGLCGVLYVLDEPTIGLHQRDNLRLLGAMKRLRDLGNTLLVVEHDKDVIAQADQVFDFGPGAGSLGGEVVAWGTPAEIALQKNSVTGPYLNGGKGIAIPSNRRPGLAPFDADPDEHQGMVAGAIQIQGARHHNLKNINVSIPLGALTVVTGVSGCGKSSLINGILYPELARRLHRATGTPGLHARIAGASAIDKVIRVDQKPIGNTPTSNPATYTGAFESIRTLFTNLPESKMRAYSARRFSFNVPGGRCETCEGTGQRRIEMHFLPDVWVPCEACEGKRYNDETLQIKFQGHSINDVLNLTCRQAVELFHNIPKIRQVIQTLVDVGLDYLQLGQSATTLSGGEAQRVKLATELSRPDTGNTLYVLDEPTTGLHFDDIAKLLDVLQRLVDLGNTVVVIEHNMDVIKCADWVIDLGPEAGQDGGQVVVAGTPEDVVRYTMMAEAFSRGEDPYAITAKKRGRGAKPLALATSAGGKKRGSKAASSVETEAVTRSLPVRELTWLRSHTGVALAETLEEGKYQERPVYIHTPDTLLGEGDLSLEAAGAATPMPWEVDGKVWHTTNRLDRHGAVCRWDGSMLTTVIEAIESSKKYGETFWNHQLVVEVPFQNKSRGWFCRAFTTNTHHLVLQFRVRPKTFTPADLMVTLGLNAPEIAEATPKEKAESRIKISRARGPSQEVELRLYSLSEVQSLGFQAFLEEAIENGFALFHKAVESIAGTVDTSLMSAAQLASYQAAERRREQVAAQQEALEASKDPDDDRYYTEKAVAAELNIHGSDHQVFLAEAVPRGTRQWHVSRCGFKEPEQVQWPAEVIDQFLEMLESIVPASALDYQRERQVCIRLSNEKVPWMTIESKERPSVRITWNVPNDVISPERLAELSLSTPGRMVAAGAVDRISLHLSSIAELTQSNLRSLIEHGYQNS